jgi:hypothetical protein
MNDAVHHMLSGIGFTVLATITLAVVARIGLSQICR